MEVAKARPITGLVLGLIFGVALAVLLQQAGIWPLDKLTLFLMPAIIALIFILIARIGRVAAPTALVIALLLLIAPLAYGLTGIGELNETGEINGGCTVEASSNVDSTVVTDTSRSNPFVVEPDGPLSWNATSPGPITDHEWEIYVNVGGFEFVVADGGAANSDMETMNNGDEPTLEGYVQRLTGQSGQQIRGVYEVGGFIDGTGGACDGFGFVKIDGGFLPTIISWIALITLLIVLVIFLLIALTGRRRPVDESVMVPTAEEEAATAATSAAGGATAVGRHESTDTPESTATKSDDEGGDETDDRNRF